MAAGFPAGLMCTPNDMPLAGIPGHAAGFPGRLGSQR